MPNFLLCFTTTDKKKIAYQIAQALVDSRVAACVNVIESVYSVYRWQGKVQKEKEYLLIIKTREDKYKKVKSRIKKIHNYSLPELLAVKIAQGSPDYLRWLEECLS